MKKVTVLLTKYSDWISLVIYYLTGRSYTHASLGLDENYYSFNYKGFCKETAALHRKRGVRKSILYELNVSDEAYHHICEQIQYFQGNREAFHYSRLGVICCFLHIPFHRRNYYFCSQFIAEVLKKSSAVQLAIPAERYLPSQFVRDLPKCCQLSGMQVNPI